jgi:microfibrillar-associated protein 1
MSEQKDDSSGFDRDQMNALLGGGFSERLLRQKGTAETGTAQGQGGRGGRGGRGGSDKQKEKDVSDMTIQETAAYLRQQQKGQQQQKQQQTASSLAAQPRHRVTGKGKVRQYHQLLSEQQEQQRETAVAPAPAPASSAPASADRRYDSEEADDYNQQHTVQEAQELAEEFVRPTRAKAAPKVVLSNAKAKAKDTAAGASGATTSAEEKRSPRKRRYDSDSSNSSEESDDAAKQPQQRQRQRQRRRRAESSSSEDSDEGISRRQRLLKQRNTTGTKERTGVFVEVPDEKKEPPPKDGDTKNKRRDDNTSDSDDAAPQLPLIKVDAKPAVVVKKVKRGEERGSGSGSSSSEEESSGSSGSSSSSSDEDDDIAPMAKPLFVPKHKRGSVQTAADSTAAAAAAEEKVVEANARRLRESRAMVQQVVTAEATKQPDYDTALEGITGARNAMPDDRDDDDNANGDDTAQDVWEVRELARLLADWDLEVARRDDEREMARRRSLTDDQKLQEDMASGRYQRPGSRPDEDTNTSGGMQRYYHKGAFYMDESEWNESDVRHKATEYAKAATGSDKVDRRKLPDIMKVKNFGFANQSKYKGMAAEVS